MEPIALASAAIAALTPYLAKAGEGAAKKIGEEAAAAGGRLFGWMRAKLGGRGQEALDDLAAKPENEDNQADLRKQLGGRSSTRYRASRDAAGRLSQC